MFGYLNGLMAISQKCLIRHINLQLSAGVTNQHPMSEVSMFFTPLYADLESLCVEFHLLYVDLRPLCVDLTPHITKPLFANNADFS